MLISYYLSIHLFSEQDINTLKNNTDEAYWFQNYHLILYTPNLLTDLENSILSLSLIHIWGMSGPFISIIISDRLIIEGIALARIADKLEQMKSIAAVSYTHLDVYKRQHRI